MYIYKHTTEKIKLKRMVKDKKKWIQIKKKIKTKIK